MADSHYLHDIAAELKVEAAENAREVAAGLAPPDDAFGDVKVQRSQMIAHVREESMRDPAYLQTVLERMAPVASTLPGGTRLRAANGVRNALELFKAARPDIYAQVTGDFRPLMKMQEGQ